MPLVGLLEYLVVGIGERRLADGLAVGEDARQTCSVVRPGGIIVPIHAWGHSGLRIEVRHRVDVRFVHVAKTSVYGPYIDALGHRLLLCGVAIVWVEVLVLIALCDIATLVHLIESLSMGKDWQQKRQCDEQQVLVTFHFDSYILKMRRNNSTNLNTSDTSRIHLAMLWSTLK